MGKLLGYLSCACLCLCSSTLYAKSLKNYVINTELQRIGEQITALDRFDSSNFFTKDKIYIDRLLTEVKSNTLIGNLDYALTLAKEGVDLSVGDFQARPSEFMKASFIVESLLKQYEAATDICERAALNGYLTSEQDWLNSCIYTLTKLDISQNNIDKVAKKVQLYISVQTKNISGLTTILAAAVFNNIGRANDGREILRIFLEKNIENDPWFSRAQFTYASILVLGKSISEGSLLFEALIRTSRDDYTRFLAQLALARVFRMQGRFAEAIQGYRLALENRKKLITAPVENEKISLSLTAMKPLVSLEATDSISIDDVRGELAEFLCTLKENTECLIEYMALPENYALNYASRIILRSPGFSGQGGEELSKLKGFSEFDQEYVNNIARNIDNITTEEVWRNANILSMYTAIYGFKAEVLEKIISFKLQVDQMRRKVESQFYALNVSLPHLRADRDYLKYYSTRIAILKQYQCEIIQNAIILDKESLAKWEENQGGLAEAVAHHEFLVSRLKQLAGLWDCQMAGKNLVKDILAEHNDLTQIENKRNKNLARIANLALFDDQKSQKYIHLAKKTDNEADEILLLERTMILSRTSNTVMAAFKKDIDEVRAGADLLFALESIHERMQKTRDNMEANADEYASENLWKKFNTLERMMIEKFEKTRLLFENDQSKYAKKSELLEANIQNQKQQIIGLENILERELRIWLRKSSNMLSEQIKRVKEQLSLACLDVEIKNLRIIDSEKEMLSKAKSERENWLNSLKSWTNNRYSRAGTFHGEGVSK